MAAGVGLAAWLGLAGGAGAQEQAGAAALTLEEVQASTVRHYPLVEAARLEVEGAEAEALAARGGFDPELKARATRFVTGPYPYTYLDFTAQQPTPFWGANLFAGWRHGTGDIPGYYEERRTHELGEVRAGLAVPLWRNRAIDRRRATLRRAELGARAATLSLEQSRLESSRTAAHRYWDWVAAGERLAVARRLLDIARERDEALAQRVERGDLPELDRTDNLRTLVQREGQVVAAERLLQQTALELSLFLRDAQGQPVRPAPERLPAGFPEPVAVARLVDGAAPAEVMERRPDVQRLQLQRAQQRLEAELARNQQAPLVDVTVAAAKDLGAGPEKLARPELELGLALDLPLLNRAATGRARAASAAAARVEAQLQLQRERGAVELRDALSAVEAARQRVGLARRELRAARQVEEGERVRLRLGESNLLFVNLREQTAAEAALREVDALAEYHKSVATLRAALALPVAAGGGG